MDALIIDDDIRVRMVETKILERAGFTVKGVDNGLAGLAVLLESEVRVIVLDISMPFLDGTRLYQELTELYPAMAKRVVFVSGQLNDQKRISFVQATGQPYLQKPFEPKELVAAVRLAEDGNHGSRQYQLWKMEESPND